MTISSLNLPKPDWLKIRLAPHSTALPIQSMMRGKKLHTVCEEAHCPNLHECWALRKTATFMILGSICTRGCRFCAITTGHPKAPDHGEPERVAEAVKQMGLRHVVITAVARDDLPDGGAFIFAETLRHIRRLQPACTIEVLPSDMNGEIANLKTLMAACPDILNHNIETVESLSPRVRARATYQRSLAFLERAKQISPNILTKSSLMLGLGEQFEEILKSMDDLRHIHVDILTLGQYLSPKPQDPFYLDVKKYWHPDEFKELKSIALSKGFRHCESGPLVRSSYHSDEQVRTVRSLEFGVRKHDA